MKEAMSQGDDAQLASYREQVLEKCSYFVDVQVWPRNQLFPERWLENFHQDEMEYALHLLDAFIFFSHDAVDALLVSAVQSLSRFMRGNRPSFANANAAWSKFLDEVIVTYVTGEVPNVTDSGYAFVRRARTLLGISEDQAMRPDEALEIVLRKPRPIIFLDDFLGSGSQCYNTWHRKCTIAGADYSFAGTSPARCYYCPLVTTQEGLTLINSTCTGLVINASHVIGLEYSMLDAKSMMWPAHLRTGAHAFVERASRRAGIPDSIGDVDDWRGFNSLGLALAFYDSVPDATLPLFYWEKNGWNPLLHRP